MNTREEKQKRIEEYTVRLIEASLRSGNLNIKEQYITIYTNIAVNLAGDIITRSKQLSENI